MGWKTKGSLDPAFEEVAFALEPSTTSNPKYGEAKTSFGYHIMMVGCSVDVDMEGADIIADRRTQIINIQQTRKITEVVTSYRSRQARKTVSGYPLFAFEFLS